MTTISSSAPVGAYRATPPAVGAANVNGAPLLPEPGGIVGGDLCVDLYAMMSQANEDQVAIGRSKIKAADAQKASETAAYKAALDRAQKAEQENRGFFDSIGVVGLVGLATGQPWVTFADTVMHMAHLTPDVLRDFEKNHASEIEMASKLWFASSNATHLLAHDQQAFAAAVALGGLVLMETGALGRETSDWGGAALMASGAQWSGSNAELAVALAADKDSAVADGIRSTERETQDYIKWAAIVGMLVAAGVATVASLGTAAAPVILIGVGLSAGGFAVSETKCLDRMVGENASMWAGLGMGLAGGIITGAGMGQAACQAAQAVNAGSQALSGVGQVQSGMYQVQDGAIAKDSSDAYADAKQANGHIDRLQKWIEQYVEELRDLKNVYTRAAGILNEAAEAQMKTTMIATGART